MRALLMVVLLGLVAPAAAQDSLNCSALAHMAMTARVLAEEKLDRSHIVSALKRLYSADDKTIDAVADAVLSVPVTAEVFAKTVYQTCVQMQKQQSQPNSPTTQRSKRWET